MSKNITTAQLGANQSAYKVDDYRKMVNYANPTNKGYVRFTLSSDGKLKLEKFNNKDYYCFHAGTAKNDKGEIVTNGGRVLGITALGKDLKEARAKAYEATEWIQFENKYMRHDIANAIL